MDRPAAMKTVYEDLNRVSSAFDEVQGKVMNAMAEGGQDIAGMNDEIVAAQNDLAEALDRANPIIAKDPGNDQIFAAVMAAYSEASLRYNSTIAGMMLGRQKIVGKEEVQFVRALKEARAMQEDAVKKMQVKSNG